MIGWDDQGSRYTAWDRIRDERRAEDEPDVDVCQLCGNYFTWRKGQKWQRCRNCHDL